MNKSKRLIKAGVGLLLGLLFAGCSNSFAQSNYDKLYDNAWYLGFGTPDYMEVWIETADVVDIQERVFRGVGGGIASVSKPPNNRGNAQGWGGHGGGGAGRYVRADLPRLIYVRWQSLIEPQTYEAYIVIPESARAIMRKTERAYCAADGKWINQYRKRIGVGLAPGGIVKVSLGGSCSKSVEILQVVGTVDKRGPDQGRNEGRYALPLSPESKAYIEKFGIPYGSW